jgi:hypothetical protein
MSDAYYQERARRRARVLVIVGALAVVVVCAVVGVGSLFYDACTKGFDRSPRAVVSAYVEAVKRGDGQVAQECWERNRYFDLETGCSEICLARVFGAQYQVMDLAVGSPSTTPEGRANLVVTASIACAEGGQGYTAEIVLDGVKSDLPWKHWAIVHSTFGGTVAEPWCK